MPWPHSLSGYRQWLIAFWHVLLLSLTYYACFLLRFDFQVSRNYQLLALETLPIVLLIKLSIFSVAGLLRGWWRYAGIADLTAIVKMSAISSAVVFAVVQLCFFISGFPRSIFLIDFLLTICVLSWCLQHLRRQPRCSCERAGLVVYHVHPRIPGASFATQSGCST